jgi:uncharacterized membrane protein YfcA
MFSGHMIAMPLAMLVGLSLGALGSGGSILTIPLLVYVAHISADKAVGMSLVIVCTTSLLGAVLNVRRGNVALRPSLLFSLVGMVGSFIGSSGTHLASRRTLLLLFSGIMLVVGLVMWRGAVARQPTKLNIRRCLSAAFAVGLLTGFLGIGGGFLIVPALVLFAGLDARMAAGTSLVVITFNSSVGLIGQLRFVNIDWTLLAGFLVFAAAGLIVGTMLLGRLTDYRLRRVFAVAVLVLGVAVGLENLL